MPQQRRAQALVAAAREASVRISENGWSRQAGGCDRGAPRFVVREVEELLCCGIIEYGFMRVECDRAVAFSCKRRGFCRGAGPAALGVL
ncbi:transposase zinc-binding domain-containing protein [Polyangium jinanense]|uniref:hypothetical protein n=1 Tax=Polyangium jinanense TaxID=2829994 RepID=UPI00233FCE63|nr:hypothetical protein [Polyangium jinanense]MDC3962847.1 transposase zinc-binding domain-containing protein [Polyangium jinanense]